MIGSVPTWLPLALFALVVWAIQRLLSKVPLTDLGTGKALAGVLGIVFLKEPVSRRQLGGIRLAIAGAVLLAAVG